MIMSFVDLVQTETMLEIFEATQIVFSNFYHGEFGGPRISGIYT